MEQLTFYPEYVPFGTCTRKYTIVAHNRDSGDDERGDFDTYKDALKAAHRYLKEGDETICCVNAKQRKIAFVFGEPHNVYSMFGPAAAAVLRKNSLIPWQYC